MNQPHENSVIPKVIMLLKKSTFDELDSIKAVV